MALLRKRPREHTMCRWIAYRGETIPLEQYVTAPAHSLVVQSQRALESTAATNGDGFGMGWYGEHAEPGLYREVRPAWSDENLRYLCRHIQSHLYFAHVRAATGTPITRPNCHPFACGRWLFMHNGMIGNWGRLRRRVEALIPNALYYRESGGNVVIVSEPLDADRAHWKPVPPGHAIVARDEQRATVEPFLA